MATKKQTDEQLAMLPGVAAKKSTDKNEGPKLKRMGVFIDMILPDAITEERTVGGDHATVNVDAQALTERAVAWAKDVQAKGPIAGSLIAIHRIVKDLYGCVSLAAFFEKGGKLAQLVEVSGMDARTVRRCVVLENLTDDLIGALQQGRISDGLAHRLALKGPEVQEQANEWLSSHDKLTGENLKDLTATHQREAVKKLDLTMQAAPHHAPKRTPETEIAEAHDYLDRQGIPRTKDVTSLSLKERVVLYGQTMKQRGGR